MQLGNNFDAIVVSRIVEIFHRKIPLFDDLLDSWKNAMHLLHQMTNCIADLLEPIFSPPLGLIRIQTPTAALMEDIARGARLANQLGVNQLLRMEI